MHQSRRYLVPALALMYASMGAAHGAGTEHAPAHPAYSLPLVGALTLGLLAVIVVWSYRAYRDGPPAGLDRDTGAMAAEDDADGEHEEGWIERNFHGLYLFFLFIVVIGAVADGYDHMQGGLHALLTFGHVVAPGGMVLILGLFGVLLWRRMRGGQEFWDAIPLGYGHVVVALPLFLIGFGTDQLWHMTFGLEQDGIETMSPPHLWVLINGLIIATGPLRRAWYRGVAWDWRAQFAMLSSAGFLIWILSYLMKLLYPYLSVFPAGWYHYNGNPLAPILGVTGIMVYSLLVLGIVLLNLVDRFDIVPGGLTYAHGLGAIGMVVNGERWYFIPAILLTGFAADLLNRWLQPGRDRHLSFRIFAFAVPVVFAGTYLLTVELLTGVTWGTHIWAGGIVFAGIGGLMASHGIQPVHQRHNNTS